MPSEQQRCTDCERTKELIPEGGVVVEGVCAACGAPLGGNDLIQFINRLARFGLGETRQPLLGREPELPHAE